MLCFVQNDQSLVNSIMTNCRKKGIAKAAVSVRKKTKHIVVLNKTCSRAVVIFEIKVNHTTYKKKLGFR